MNIKIKSNGVTCLVGEDYDRVFTALRNQLTDDDGQIFSERIPGHEYLQWELPGDGWVPLSKGDPLMAQEVRQELHRRKQTISQKFGNNQEMAQKILSVPDDNYVYYKADTNGHLLIRLTAWGYRYPERVGGGGSTGVYTPKEKTVLVSIHVLYDNKPLTNKELFLNGFKRITDTSGIYHVGELPVGYKFEIKVDDKLQVVEVQVGQGDILIDATVFASVEIRATLDGHPYEGAAATLSYWGHEFKLTTDISGKAIAKVPKDPDNGMCTISIGNEHQQSALVQPITVFTFNINSPKEDEFIEEDKTEEPIDDSDRETVETSDHLDQREENQKEENNYQEPSPQIEENQTVKEEIEEKKEEPLVPDETPKEDTSQPLEEKQRSSSFILEILAALSIIALIAFTYLFCYGMLFG